MPRHPLVGRVAFGSSSNRFASVLDAGEAIFTRSARSAIALALRHSHIGVGSQVLIPNYYCTTMIAPIEKEGATPVFYPITHDGLPDLDWLRKNEQINPRAMLAVHFFGIPRAFDSVREFCDANGIVLIEDCAHAFYGSSDGKPVGSVGDYAIASLPKFFPVMEGGLLVSHSRDLSALRLTQQGVRAEFKGVWNMLEAAACHERLYGFNTAIRACVRLLASVKTEYPPVADVDAAASAMGASEVRENALVDPLIEPMRSRRSDDWVVAHTNVARAIEVRRRNFRRLTELLRDCPGASILTEELPDGAVPYVVPIRFQATAEIFPRLRALGLPVLRWDLYWPGAIESSRDIGRDWGHHVMQILCHQDLTERDIDTIAALTREIAAEFV